MSNIHIQGANDIDQPAELEGVGLNWGPAEFIRTASGPRALRTAPATPEFWRVWERNEEALKAVGISCSRRSSGDWQVEWWNDICIDRSKSYTLSEVIDVVKQTLDSVSEHAVEDKLRYSSTRPLLARPRHDPIYQSERLG